MNEFLDLNGMVYFEDGSRIELFKTSLLFSNFHQNFHIFFENINYFSDIHVFDGLTNRIDFKYCSWKAHKFIHVIEVYLF